MCELVQSCKKKSEGVLLELLNHLIEAQNQGKSAEEVFGDNPIQYCKEIVSTLPNPPKSSIFFVGLWFIFYLESINLFIGSLSACLFKSSFVDISVLSSLISTLLIMIATWLVLRFLNLSSFQSEKRLLHEVLLGIFVITALLIIIGLPLITTSFATIDITFQIKPITSFITAVTLFLVAQFGIVRYAFP
ncbi:DUF1129 family protein [Hazenella sp. IB182353]|nr:DUF1129 family protein [Polycladospora coralii]